MPREAPAYETGPSGTKAFIPEALPLDPPPILDPLTHSLLSEADRSLGRLDMISEVLPDPDRFVAMFVRQEAVLSSQIEGTQSSLADVLAAEAGQPALAPRDAPEVLSYVRAMNHGIERLDEFPLSLRLIREIHGVLMQQSRGEQADPGNFRAIQNWIGPERAPITQASFVPPTVPTMLRALGNLESFLHANDELPPLVRCAITHAQFETIHPFLDGNGRVGRLLITFQLVEQGVLRQPLLYLSHFLKRNRGEYYDRLMQVRQTGEWLPWISFFLRGVVSVGEDAVSTARGIVALREQQLRMAGSMSSKYAVPLLDLLYRRPIIQIGGVAAELGCTFAQASGLIATFEAQGMLSEITGQQRNRTYRFDPYLQLFQASSVTGDDVDADAIEHTGSTP